MKNTLMQYALQAAKYIFPFITIPYLTRVLGPEVYAIRAYILAAMTFMQIFLDYGFLSYGTRAIAQAKDDIGIMRSETSAIMISRLALCVVGAIVLAGVTVLIPIMAANPKYVAIAYICVCFKALLPDFIFMGLEEMGIITYRFVLSEAISTILTFTLVHGPNDLLWVPALECLAAFIAFAWSWENVLIKRKITPCSVSFSKLYSAFSTSTVFFLSSAATTVFTSLTTLMIGIFIPDAAEISYWALSMTVVSAIQALYAPISNSLYPHMVKRRDFNLFKKLLVSGMVAVIIGTGILVLLSKYAMMILGGNGYLDGAYVLRLVSPLLIISFPSILMGFPVLAATGHEKQLTSSSVASAIFHIAGLCLLASFGVFSLTTVAVLRCGTEFVMLFIRSVFVIKVLKER